VHGLQGILNGDTGAALAADKAEIAAAGQGFAADAMDVSGNNIAVDGSTYVGTATTVATATSHNGIAHGSIPVTATPNLAEGTGGTATSGTTTTGGTTTAGGTGAGGTTTAGGTGSTGGTTTAGGTTSGGTTTTGGTGSGSTTTANNDHNCGGGGNGHDQGHHDDHGQAHAAAAVPDSAQQLDMLHHQVMAHMWG
jgi:trimeric autotransporter adhesin